MSWGDDRISAWRPVVVAACVVTAAAHVPITEDHLREAPYIGVSFISLELAAIALAVLLVLADTRLRYAAAATTGGLAITAYILSRSVGLPQIEDDVGNWTDPLGLVALTAEAVVVVGGIAAASGRFDRVVARRTAVIGAVLMIGAGLGATVVADGSEPGPDTMSVHTSRPAAAGEKGGADPSGPG